MVLVCENPLIEQYLDMVLRRNGCDVLVVGVARALEMLQSGKHHISLLITNKPAVFFEVAAKLPWLYLSAAPDPNVAAAFSGIRVLQKPFSVSELIRAVTEMAGAA